jgi:hypothetical protein
VGHVVHGDLEAAEKGGELVGRLGWDGGVSTSGRRVASTGGSARRILAMGRGHISGGSGVAPAEGLVHGEDVLVRVEGGTLLVTVR